MPKHALLTALAEDEYCCPYGFLKLCRLRGEKKPGMVLAYKINFWTLKHHYRLLKRGQHECQRYPSICLRPVIEDIQNSPSNLGDDSNLGEA